VLQDDGVGEHAVERLGAAVAAVHRQIEPKGVAVLHVDVARLAASQRVDATVERTVGLHVHFDLRVPAVNGHVVACSSSIAVDVEFSGTVLAWDEFTTCSRC